MKHGSCLCGQLTYRVRGDLRPVSACHCTQCRKSSGNYVTATSARRSDVEIDGQVQWYASSQNAKRGFCLTCGSNVFWDGPGENISIMAGTLDKPTGVTTAGHIYCADKGDYYEISDGLPQVPGADPKLTTQVDSGPAGNGKRN